MKKFQVVGIGNAMVDVLAHADDAFLAANGIDKGIMQLIDMAARLIFMRASGRPRKSRAGRRPIRLRASRIWAGARPMSARCKDDQLGAIFAHDLRAQGAVYETPHGAQRRQSQKPGAASCW